MIVEFELVKRETDQVIKRLVQDVYIDGYKKFPDKVEELLQEGFVIADNRLIEETNAAKEPTLTPEDSKKLAEVMKHMMATSDEMVKAVNQYRSEIVSDVGKIAILLNGIEEVENDDRSNS